MRAILTVIGKDKVGIVANVSQLLAKENINILDISQTIMEGSFTMIMSLDLKENKRSFQEIRDVFKIAENELDVKINIQREEIFDAMHKI